MNEIIKNILFYSVCFSLVFTAIPKAIQINFVGWPVQSKLVFYPFITGLIYTIYCQYKYKNIFVNFDNFCFTHSWTV